MKYTVAELAETFAELLRALGGALDRAGVEWMLVGGLAVGAWTEPRGTKDCDLAIAVPEDATSLARTLADAGLGVPFDGERVRRWAKEWDVEERLDSAISTARRGATE